MREITKADYIWVSVFSAYIVEQHRREHDRIGCPGTAMEPMARFVDEAMSLASNAVGAYLENVTAQDGTIPTDLSGRAINCLMTAGIWPLTKEHIATQLPRIWRGSRSYGPDEIRNLGKKTAAEIEAWALSEKK